MNLSCKFFRKGISSETFNLTIKFRYVTCCTGNDIRFMLQIIYHTLCVVCFMFLWNLLHVHLIFYMLHVIFSRMFCGKMYQIICWILHFVKWYVLGSSTNRHLVSVPGCCFRTWICAKRSDPSKRLWRFGTRRWTGKVWVGLDGWNGGGIVELEIFASIWITALRVGLWELVCHGKMLYMTRLDPKRNINRNWAKRTQKTNNNSTREHIQNEVTKRKIHRFFLL